MKNTWMNLGDINFLQYGGHLVRKAYAEEQINKYPSLKHYYEVIFLVPDDDRENMMFAGICNIDLQDYVDKPEIFSYAGYPELIGKSLNEIAESIGLERFTADIVSYYGVANLGGESPKSCYPCCPEDWLVTREEVQKWLESYGWKEEIAG